jgi:hypothetical protein
MEPETDFYPTSDKKEGDDDDSKDEDFDGFDDFRVIVMLQRKML